MKNPVHDDRISTGKEFAQVASDLTDEEIQKTIQIVNGIRMKYAGKPSSAKNLEAMRDEVLTRLTDINILATLDPSPVFYGEPPILEIIGKVSGDVSHKEGFDHERKQDEVVKAKELGEDYRGQKERYNKLKPRKNA